MERSSGKHLSAKVPTTVLIKPDGVTLEAFGYEAEDRYSELVDEGGHAPYYFFQRFKMILYENKVCETGSGYKLTHFLNQVFHRKTRLLNWAILTGGRASTIHVQAIILSYRVISKLVAINVQHDNTVSRV